MLNREYRVRANRQGQGRSGLEGEQLDLSFPARRGRPTRFKRLERAGQMRLELHGQLKLTPAISQQSDAEPETFESALDLCFPERTLTELELTAEFERLFPPEA